MRDIDFSASFPTIDERRVIDLEETLNMSFPQDYRNFLLSHLVRCFTGQEVVFQQI
jgi:hypothetical protein